MAKSTSKAWGRQYMSVLKRFWQLGRSDCSLKRASWFSLDRKRITAKGLGYAECVARYFSGTRIGFKQLELKA